MAYAPLVLSTAFLDACLATHKLLKATNYLLSDPDGEQRHGVHLKEVAARSKRIKGGLFKGQSIYCTEHVYGGFDTYKRLVEVNGGKCMLFRGRAGAIPGKARGMGGGSVDADGEEDVVYLISGTKLEEQRLWAKFRSMVDAVGKVPRVVRTDWMLDAALRQEVRGMEGYEVSASDGEGADA